MWSEETPIETYKVSGTEIYVKREDLFGQYPAPPLAKLRGGRKYVERLKQNGWKTIGVFDTRISKAGQGIACVSSELGLNCVVGFPKLKRQADFSKTHKIAQSLGATLYPLKAGRTAVCYHQFAQYIQKNQGFVLPLGLVCRDTVTETSKVAEKAIDFLLRQGIQIKTIILSTGTGTIATGVHLGTRKSDVKVVGVSCGMSVDRQFKRMRLMGLPDSIDYRRLGIVPPEHDYYDALDTSSCPFPTSPYYDMKAWKWMVKCLDKIEQPILFWNIGV